MGLMDESMSLETTGVAAVLLAAGGSRRFGSPKQLALWKGQPLIRHMAETLSASGFEWLVVVVGFRSHQARSVLGPVLGPQTNCVDNPDWSQGQSSSIRIGLDGLPPHIGAALFQPCDQPLLTPQTLNRSIDRHRKHPEAIIVPRYGEHRGSPVLWPRRFFQDLRSLEGDTGGRALLCRHREHIVELPVENADEGRDADTPEALERLSRL